MGLSAAYWLTKLGNSRVVLLEQHTIGNDYCSSGDANRVFRYSYGNDKLYTRMAVETLPLWKDLERATGEELLVQSGLLLVQGSDDESNKFNQDSYRTLNELELGAEELSGTDLKKRFPQFSASHAYFDPHGGVLLASKILTTLAAAAKRQGATILENHKATRLTVKDQVEVESSQDTVRCKHLILTVGPWSNKFLNKRLPSINPTRQQIVYFQPANLGPYRPSRFPAFFADQYYGIPAAGIEAVKVSHKGLPDPVDPDQANRAVDLGVASTFREVCGRFIPDLATAPVHRTKVCLYDMAPGSDFIITRDPDHSSIVYGYGFSGHGFKFGIMVGKLLAELATEQPPSFDLTRFTPTVS
jgi:monomeric sarcosine oxidase